jgi:hypothetical protein
LDNARQYVRVLAHREGRMLVNQHVNADDDGRDESKTVNPGRLPGEKIPSQFNARQALCLQPP